MRIPFLFVLILCLFGATSRVFAEPDRKSFTIGFIEGGSHPVHSEVRQLFRKQLQAMLPPELEAVYVPQGFKSADWDREDARRAAAELAADLSVDIVVAFGPWTVEDLLEAGFGRPIVAVYRFNPQLEGLLDSSGRPVAENLTVRSRPGKLESDISRLKYLINPRRVAFLNFPSSDEQEAVFDHVSRVGRDLGIEFVSAEAYDRDSAFAYFKAYGRLKPRPEVLYVGPLWGFDASKMRQFYQMTGRDRVPVFSSEGEYQTLRGALAAGSGESLRVTARLAAWKVLRIMQGAVPADLAVAFPEQPGLSINEAAASHYNVFVGRRLRLSANLVEPAPAKGAESFTLSEAIDRALVQNPGYLARYDALEAAVRAAAQARSVYLPNLRAEASAFYYDDNTVHNDDQFDNTRFHAGVTLDQEILSLGAIRDIQLAANNKEASRAELRQATLDLEYAVTVAFLNHAKAVGVFEIWKTQRRIAEECLQIARVREQLGEEDRADALRWEDELLQSLRSLEIADLNLQVARILLNTLLGRPADLELNLVTESLAGKPLGELLDLLDAVAETPGAHTLLREFLASESVNHNPAFEIQDLAVAGLRTKLARNTAGFLPRIGLRASLDLVDERPSTEAFGEEHATWSAGARLELPLFLGFGRFKERKKLYAELSSLEYLKDDISLEVASRIDIRLTKLLSLASQLRLSVSSSRLAGEYLQVSIDQYADGQRSIAEVLESISNHQRAQTAIKVDLTGGYQAAAGLVKELGWSVHGAGQSPAHMLLARLRPLIHVWLLER